MFFLKTTGNEELATCSSDFWRAEPFGGRNPMNYTHSQKLKKKSKK